jgi:hypothetical protein
MSSANFARDLEKGAFLQIVCIFYLESYIIGGHQHQRDQIYDKKQDQGGATEEHEARFTSASPYAKYAAPDARIWGLYLEEAEAEDRELMEPWNKDLDSLLIFVCRTLALVGKPKVLTVTRLDCLLPS